MDVIIWTIDNRRYGGKNPNFLKNVTFEDILKYFKKHKNATSVLLFNSPKHENEGAFYTKDEYLSYMECFEKAKQ